MQRVAIIKIVVVSSESFRSVMLPCPLGASRPVLGHTHVALSVVWVLSDLWCALSPSSSSDCFSIALRKGRVQFSVAVGCSSCVSLSSVGGNQCYDRVTHCGGSHVLRDRGFALQEIPHRIVSPDAQGGKGMRADIRMLQGLPESPKHLG